METIKWQVEEKTARLIFNRPEVHNAFNDQMMADIKARLLALDKNDDIRLLVVEGEGPSFCAGADLNWMKSMKDYTEDENYTDSIKLFELFEMMNNVKIPTLGKVHGKVLGGGMGILSCLDHVVALESAEFGLPEVQIGLIPAVISPFVLNKVGENMARSLFLSGNRIKAQRALEVGLIHEVVSGNKDDLEKRLQKVIESFLRAAPMAQRQAKELIGAIKEFQHKPEYLKQELARKIARKRISDEGQQGMEAILNKKPFPWGKRS